MAVYETGITIKIGYESLDVLFLLSFVVVVVITSLLAAEMDNSHLSVPLHTASSCKHVSELHAA